MDDPLRVVPEARQKAEPAPCCPGPLSPRRPAVVATLPVGGDGVRPGADVHGGHDRGPAGVDPAQRPIGGAGHPDRVAGGRQAGGLRADRHGEDPATVPVEGGRDAARPVGGPEAIAGRGDVARGAGEGQNRIDPVVRHADPRHRARVDVGHPDAPIADRHGARRGADRDHRFAPSGGHREAVDLAARGVGDPERSRVHDEVADDVARGERREGAGDRAAHQGSPRLDAIDAGPDRHPHGAGPDGHVIGVDDHAGRQVDLAEDTAGRRVHRVEDVVLPPLASGHPQAAQPVGDAVDLGEARPRTHLAGRGQDADNPGAAGRDRRGRRGWRRERVERARGQDGHTGGHPEGQSGQQPQVPAAPPAGAGLAGPGRCHRPLVDDVRHASRPGPSSRPRARRRQG